MRKEGYNTNLASEFYVMSMLHRKGINAILTLGNKKAVDIMIEKNGKIITIDVKGLLEKSGSFPADNIKKKDKTHFIVFVSFKEITNHKISLIVVLFPHLASPTKQITFILFKIFPFIFILFKHNS